MTADRSHAFGERKVSPLDRAIFFLRTRQFLKHLPASSSLVVELGSGYDGALLRMLLRSGRALRAYGMDLSVQKDPPEGLTLEEGDLEHARTSLPDASADVVLSLAVIEHLRHPEHLFEEAWRILRPGGRIILTTPSPSGKPVLEFMAYRLGVIDEAEIRDHKRYFSKREVEDLFARAGFEGISVRLFLFGLNTIAVARKP